VNNPTVPAGSQCKELCTLPLDQQNLWSLIQITRRTWMFVRFFIYLQSFTYAVSSSDYTVLNVRMINKWWIGKDTERIGMEEATA
jgi:hypothetical protein